MEYDPPKKQNEFLNYPQMLLRFIIQIHPEHLRPFTCFFLDPVFRMDADPDSFVNASKLESEDVV